MTKIRRLFSLLMAVALLSGLCACGGSSGSTAADSEPSETNSMTLETSVPDSTADPEPTDSEQSDEPQLIPAYTFEPIGQFSAGLIWVSYQDDSGVKKKGIINEKGILIYTAHDDVTGTFDYDTDGYAYYTSETGDVIIDENGREHLVTQKTEEESISICGHGNGVFILRKDIANFSQKASYVRIVDADGNIIFDEQELPEVSDVHSITGYVSTDFTCYGEGIFKSEEDILSSSYTAFFNSNTGEIFRDKYSSFATLYRKFYIHDGQAYFLNANYSNPYNAKAAIVSTEIFSSEDTYSNWYESLTQNDFVSYRVIPTFPDGVSMVEYGSFEEDLALVLLLGADGRYYITVVNRDGEQQYEPITLPETQLSIPRKGKEYILYEDGQKRDFTNYYGFAPQYYGVQDLLYAKGRFIYWEDGNTCLVDVVGNKTTINIDSTIISFDGKYIYLQAGVYNTETNEVLDVISVWQ